jgi:hypothetical protein
VIDAEEEVQNRFDYDTFGFVITETNPVLDAPFGFASRVSWAEYLGQSILGTLMII